MLNKLRPILVFPVAFLSALLAELLMLVLAHLNIIFVLFDGVFVLVCVLVFGTLTAPARLRKKVFYILYFIFIIVSVIYFSFYAWGRWGNVRGVSYMLSFFVGPLISAFFLRSHIGLTGDDSVE